MSEPVKNAPHHQYEAFLRQLPADWDQQEITQLGAVIGGGTPSREVPSFWRGPIPWVTPGEVSGEASKLLHDTQEHISPSGLAGSGANLLPAGSLLVTTRATLGARVINAVPMATNQGFKSIVFKKPEEASYYYHLFEKVKPELVRRASGTTFLEISGAEFGSIKLPSPPPEEKLKIAQLLDTLDTAIHQTEVIVEKLKQVKQGLLHDLLTRGVDANGEPRPSYEAAPDLYKKTAIGWRPKDWEICQVSSVLSGIDAGKSPDCQDIPAKGDQWGVLKVGAVHPDGLKLNENKVIEEARLKNPTYLVRNGDLLLSRANTFELVGLVCYVTNHPERLMLSDKTLRLSVKANRMTTTFLYWQLQHPKTRTQIEIAATGTSGSMKNISQGGVEQLWISRPQIDEQEEITKRLLAASDRCRDEQEKLSKMREMKSGLMDDLLTGRVRVTPLLAQ